MSNTKNYDISNVVTVYGALRSGTTLLHLMLDGNPQIAGPGETDFIYDHLNAGPDGSYQYDFEALLLDRIYRTQLSEDDPEPESAKTLINRLAARNCSGDQKMVLVQHRNIAKILDQFPEMRVIHMIRDPRDVARSSIGMGWAGDVYHGAQHWIETETDWGKSAHRLKDDQLLTFTFKDLISKPEETLTRLCDFIGVPFHPDMLNYNEHSTYDKPDASLVEQWRKKMTPREVGLVEGRVGSLLKDRGFTPSGHPEVIPSGRELALLSLRSKAAVWRTRAKRYGLADSLKVAVARKLGHPGLASGAQRRIDDRMKAHLK